MGRTLDQLGLGETGPDPHDALAHARKRADQMVARIQAMEDDQLYQFAYGTLVDMRLTIEKTGRVSDAQEAAVQNIAVGAQRYQDGVEDRQRGGSGSRRYEGFRGRRW